MKKTTIFSTLALAGLLVGCTEFSEQDRSLNTGSANFTKYMAVGNSITAGFQSNALFEAGQMKAYGKLIADQTRTNFATPTVGGDGIGGRIKWDGSFTASGSPAFTYAPLLGGSANNTGYYGSSGNYNNLGIPGMITVIPGTQLLGNATDFFDVNVNSTASDALVGPGGVGGSRKNPYFNVVLANGVHGTNIAAALTTSQPTFVTLWLGNNDVLGYATSGGTNPSATTDPAVFETKYAAILDHILNLTSAPKVAVATIPNVVTIPFFTTVNPSVAPLLPAGVSLRYQKNAESVSVGTGVASATDLATYKHMITLLGSSYAPRLGTQYGGWIKTLADAQSLSVSAFYAAVLVPAGIDTTQPFGFHPQNPWPNYLILDQDEVIVAGTAVAQLNAKIKSVAGNASRSARVVVVDVSAEFDKIAAATATGSTVSYQGVPVDSRFILGGLFSYDGVHPSDLGHGIIANMFINGINKKFSANIQEVALRNLDGVRYGKIAPVNEAMPVQIPEAYLQNTLNVLQGSW